VRKFFGVLLTALLAFGFISCESKNESEILDIVSQFTIVSPYDGIEWYNFGQYKAALHTHTTRSDGRNTLTEMIEEHYRQGFDILAITDHNEINRDWTSGANALTADRYAEITAGVGRDGRELIRIPLTNEQSMSEHMNSFFTDFNNVSGSGFSGLVNTIKMIEQLGGISHINHPGRYTGGMRPDLLGYAASNNQEIVQRYVDLFMEFPFVVGMEIINKTDVESRTDRILWDNILRQTMPHNRFVWGFSNDDSHSTEAIGLSYNVFVMPENTAENVRYAMENGRFYAVARVAKAELGETFIGNEPTPIIRNIVVNDVEASITISTEHADRIDWIYDGNVITQGNTIKLENHVHDIGSYYIRANIIGPGGISFTQPFSITRN